jgi:uncharacterized protein YxeA
MEKNWIILILVILVAVPLIIYLFKQNRKDRKNLFRKLPGDYPEPTYIESEIDKEINKK